MRQVLPVIGELPLWPVISGSVFFLLFIAIVVYVYRRSGKGLYEDVGHMVLHHDDRTSTHDIASDGMKTQENDKTS
jgi:hypothetical protein